MTIRRVFIYLFVFILLLAGCSGDSKKEQKKPANEGTAHIRVACMAFPLVDVNFDDQLLFDDLVYPFISEYQDVSAGKHDLKVMPASDGGAANAASLDLTLDDGHSYLLVSYGGAADHTLKLIDETETLTKIGPEQNWVLILHLIPNGPALDGYIGGNLVVQNLAYGQDQFYAAPIGSFETKITLNGMDMAVYQADMTGLPSLYTVVTISGSLLKPVISFDGQTPLDLMDFFNELAQQGHYLDTAQEMLNQSGVAEQLAGPGLFTLFAPWDASFVNVSTDPAQVKNTVMYHIVAESLPPDVLAHRAKLATLQGSPLMVTTAETAPYLSLNGEAGVYSAYRTSSGILYEIDHVLTPPTGK